MFRLTDCCGYTEVQKHLLFGKACICRQRFGVDELIALPRDGIGFVQVNRQHAEVVP